MKIAYLNPFNDGTGYANAGIRTILAMDSVGLDVRPVEFKLANQTVPAPQRVQQLAGKPYEKPDVIIQHMLPPGFVYRAGAKNIGFFHCETTHFIPSKWQHYANLMDELWVSCRQNIEALKESGVTKPIRYVPIGQDPFFYDQEFKPLDIQTNNNDNVYTFYSISDWSHRKNVETVIKAYFLAFSRNDNVRLILKCYIDGHNWNDSEKIITERINQIKIELGKYGNPKEYPPIVLITNYLSDDEINRLHATGNCCVFAERGAAWNLVAFDAMGFGNDVIASNWGGQTEFMDGSNRLFLIDGKMIPVEKMQNCPYKGVYHCSSEWFDPYLDELAHTMSSMYNHKVTKSENKQNRAELLREFSLESVGEKIKDILCK